MKYKVTLNNRVYELDEMEQREELENKLKFAKRQEKRFNRIAKYSLDKNNQQKAEARAKEWKEKREKSKSV